MIVNAPEVKRMVDDYDFTFAAGMVMQITVNTDAGDTITFTDPIVIRSAAKPSMNDPDIMIPAEEISVYKTHLAAVHHRVREIVELTPEQQHEWAKTLKEITKTVQ